jgi:protein tyrosine phosphatase (PTP) superfamily phosphohydrolase (DUF442 family)
VEQRRTGFSQTMNLSKIADNLYIGTTPKAKDYELLHQLGVTLVINMRFGLPPRRDPNSPAMKSLWLPVIDSPIFPIPIQALRKGVQEALKVIEQGGIVYAHCSRGRHRGPAMGACILIAEGMTAEDAMSLIKLQRPVADPYIWYIDSRIRKFSREWVNR